MLWAWRKRKSEESSTFTEVVTALLAGEDGGVASSESLLVRGLLEWSDWSDLATGGVEDFNIFQSLGDECHLSLMFSLGVKV